MTQQNNPLNLEFQLSCDGVQITYLTNDQDGKPHFMYKDAEYDRSYIGDEIRIQQSEFGSLVTVTLRYLPDADSTTITLTVPPVWVRDLSESVQTLAIKCLHIMTMLPPSGAAQSYEAILMKGSVKSTIFA